MATLAARRLDALFAETMAREGVSANTIGRRLGWISSQTTKYRKGLLRLDSEALARIAKQFAVSADWLVGLSDARHGTAGEIAEPGPPPRDPLEALARIERVLASQVEDLAARVRQLEQENSSLRAEVQAAADLEQTYVTEAGRIWEEVLGDLPKAWQVRILRRLGVMGAGGAVGEEQQQDTPGAAAR